MAFLAAVGEHSHEARPGHRLDISYRITGAVTPFIAFRLAPGQGLVTDVASILLHDEAIELRPWPGAGERLRLAVNGATVRGKLTATTTMPGRVGAFDLAGHGGRLLCPLDAFLAAGPGVAVTFYARYRAGGDDARRGITILLLEGPGWAFLKAAGDVIEERLTAGSTLCVEAGAIAAMTAAVDFDPIGSEATHPHSFARLKGPGRVWLQSAGRRASLAEPLVASNGGGFSEQPVQGQNARAGAAAR